MDKLNITDITNHQVVDIRPQHAYQAGHLKDSMNLIPRHFKEYATTFLDKDEPLVFVVGADEEAKVEDLTELAKEAGYNQISGYLLIDEVPAEDLQQLETIPAEEMLNKVDDFILLDVRHPDDITRAAPEKNLVNIPFKELVDQYKTLDSGKQVYTLCGSGNSATAAASFLESKGFESKVVEGGMKAIQELKK